MGQDGWVGEAQPHAQRCWGSSGMTQAMSQARARVKTGVMCAR